MSLSRKIVLFFVLLGGCIGLGCYAAISYTIFPAFEEFEVDSAMETIDRVERVMDAERRTFETLVVEYAHWNATYNFLQGKQPDYVEENLGGDYWQSIGVDMIMLFDRNGDLYWSADTTTPGQREIDPGELIIAPGGDAAAVFDFSGGVDRRGGVLRTTRGPVQFASAPVLTTYAEGPPMGTFVIARFIGSELVASVSAHASTSANFLPVTPDGAAGFTLAELQRMAAAGETRTIENREETMIARLLLRDPFGAPVGVVEVELEHLITEIGADTIRAAMLLIAGITTIFLVIGITTMRRLVVKPVNKLAGSMHHIRETGDLDVAIEMARGDEIGRLAFEFDELTTNLHLAKLELEATRDVAVEASRTKSDFLARMSHEIRTPMNGVLGMTELLRNTTLDFEQRRYADTIYSSADSLLDIINDILDFSKIEAGKLDLEIRDFDLGDVIEEAVDALAPQAHKKGLELINDVAPDLHASFQGDPVRVRQVLTNLVANAIKFTNRGEVVVRASHRDLRDGSSEVEFEVVDTGVGIKADKQRLIFESFAQEDGSTTRIYGGTGLGLAISRQLVELMGGSLEVESTPGTGSRFGFTLRMPHGAAKVQTPHAMPVSVAGKRILVVDDNATNREIMETQLGGWRAICDTADGAVSALQKLQDAAAAGQLYDLVILDMHMPRTDGLQLARKIRAEAAYDGVSLMLLSSVAMPASETLLEELRIAGQLTKPIRQGQLYDSLAVVLSGEDLTGRYSRASSHAIRTLAGRVLLAEDNPVNQAVALGMLDSLGVDVAVVVDGKAAVNAVSAQPFDLVLMDCQMPEMDGLEATRQIRASESASGSRRLPVVALTANAMAGDRERCLAAGMDDYLGKPFTMDQLHAVMSVYLVPGEQRQGSEPEAESEIVDPSLFDTQSLAVQALDRSVLDVLAELQQPGAPSLVAKVVSIYLEGANSTRDSLLAAIDAGDCNQVREIAHAFKSSSMNVGATRLADVCKRIEHLARENKTEETRELKPNFELEFDRAIDALQNELEAAAK